MALPKEQPKSDAPLIRETDPTSRVDPDLPGVVGTEEIHGNTTGYPSRHGEPEPEGWGYSGQGGVTGKTPQRKKG